MLNGGGRYTMLCRDKPFQIITIKGLSRDEPF